MRRYEKPKLYIERFELSQHIASCAWDMSNFKTLEECSAESDEEWIGIPGINAFLELNEKCTDGPWEDICYTNGSSGSNVFNS